MFWHHSMSTAHPFTLQTITGMYHLNAHPRTGIAHQVSLTVEKFPDVESLHDIASQVKHKFHKVETAALFRCLCLGKTLISNWYVLYPEGGC